MNFHNWILCYRELCYHDSLLSWQQKKKKKWIYQWICNIQIICQLYYANLLRIIVFEFFEHWTMLIVFLFLVLILSIRLQSIQVIQENFVLELQKNMIKPLSLRKNLHLCGKGPIESVLFICPSICQSVSNHLWHIFLRI